MTRSKRIGGEKKKGEREWQFTFSLSQAIISPKDTCKIRITLVSGGIE